MTRNVEHRDPTKQTGPSPEQPAAEASGIAWLPLFIAIAITALMTVYPNVLVTDAAGNGRADHMSAVLLFWSMSAGYVSGVGFIPRHRLPALLLSGRASLLALALALICVFL